ncbi:hypothetical protein D3C73_1431790 [compost metagenome]
MPDISMARVGEQLGAAWKSSIRRPSVSSLSRLGVWISLPRADRSEKPRSSATISRMFGCLTVGVAMAWLAPSMSKPRAARGLRQFMRMLFLF